MTPIVQATRITDLPSGILALTTTARGMVNNTMVLSAQAAFQELMGALGPSGLITQVASTISIAPDEPQRPDDPHCRYVAGVVFGYRLTDGQGQCTRPDVPLTGSLAWQTLVPGRYAVFTHMGPYANLHQTWRAIYQDWLPASGCSLRGDAPPMELCINTPYDTAPQDLHTEIWLPIAT
jgi:AraC family transcriptional regulator